MTVRIGIDLVCPDEVRESLSIHGERYLERIYTREERVDAAGDPARLAAVFAAKEATMKALLAGEQPVDWRSISVRRDPAGRASVRLTGTAHALARSA